MWKRWRDIAVVGPRRRSGTGVVGASDGAGRRVRSGRESIESFVVVFLAFLVWSIEAEGFVIPTGSMAPTLLGRHKDIVCPDCGHLYTVNADREVEPGPLGRSKGLRIGSGTCENCRYETALAAAPSFSGDRIYVMKDGVSLPFLAQASQVKLKRWDVAVFKLPEDPEVRYIKRLVGMPGEVVRIQGGDLWVRPSDRDGAFERPPRPLEHQQAMQQLVYDDEHRAASLQADRRWVRWAATESGAWSQPEPGTYVTTGARDQAELRYHHVVPSPDQWAAIREGRELPSPPRATLITDYSSYNTDVAEEDRWDPRRSARAWLQPHWVGDLTLSLRVRMREPAGRLRLELIKAGRSDGCEIDLASGETRLFHGGSELGAAALTAMGRAGRHDLTLANVDGRLTLWVDGGQPFGEGRSYASGAEPSQPSTADLEPARIAVKGAAVELSGLVLKRDVYYTLEPSEHDYANLGEAVRYEAPALFGILADPGLFPLLTHLPPRDYPIAAGRYLMLGDNSPWSRDGRAWGLADQIDPAHPDQGWDDSGRASWEVPEALLVGKAFCVYWPHPRPIWPNFRLAQDLCFPVLPYIQRMRWIR